MVLVCENSGEGPTDVATEVQDEIETLKEEDASQLATYFDCDSDGFFVV